MKLKLTLTNVTYTVNYCKLVGMSSHLEDFISVNFNPPGAMSAGLTCHMTITFEPKVYKLIERGVLISEGVHCVQASMELGPKDVSLLERCLHFRGCIYMYIVYRLQWSWGLKMCPY